MTFKKVTGYEWSCSTCSKTEFTREKNRPGGWRSGPIVDGQNLDLCPACAVDPAKSMEHPNQAVEK